MGRLGHLVNILMLLVVVGFSVKTVLRNAEWTNTETLGMAAVPVNPGNAKVLMTLGNIYAQQVRECALVGEFLCGEQSGLHKLLLVCV